MDAKSLEDRVTLLENELRGLPGRVGAVETQVTALTEQYVQFRLEVRDEFSATRALIAKVDMKVDALSVEMHTLHAIALMEMQKLYERSLNQSRMFHEEVIARFKLIERG